MNCHLKLKIITCEIIGLLWMTIHGSIRYINISYVHDLVVCIDNLIRGFSFLSVNKRSRVLQLYHRHGFDSWCKKPVETCFIINRVSIFKEWSLYFFLLKRKCKTDKINKKICKYSSAVDFDCTHSPSLPPFLIVFFEFHQTEK